MKHIKKIKIDIDKKNFEVIPSVQYDSNTRYLHIQLLNDSVPFDITGCSVILSGVKEDGNSIFNSCDIINSEIGFIQAEVTEQMNAIPGYIDCEIKIYNGEGVLTSKKFTIKVTASQTSREVVSSNEFKALTDALTEVQGIDNKFGEVYEHLDNKVDFCIDIAKYGIRSIDFNHRPPYSADEYKIAYDNMEGVKRALEDMHDKGITTIVFPKGYYPMCYRCEQTGKPHFSHSMSWCIRIPSYMTVDLNGSTIKVIYDSENRNPYDKSDFKPAELVGVLFKFDKTYCSTIKNGKLIGDRYDRAYNINTKETDRRVEQTYGIRVTNGSRYCKMENMEIHGFMGDGIQSDGSHNLDLGSIDQKKTFYPGYIDTKGSYLTDKSDRYTTDFMECINLKTREIILRTNLGYAYVPDFKNQQFEVTCYNSSKELIGRTTSEHLYYIILPEGTKFIRLTLFKEDIEQSSISKTFQITTTPSTDFEVLNTKIYDCNRGGMSNLPLDTVIRGCNLYDNGLSNNAKWINFPDTTRYAINCEDTVARSITIENCYIHNCYNVILLSAKRSIINNNIFENCGLAIVNLYNAKDCIISNNQLNKCGAIVGTTKTGNKKIIVRGNICNNISTVLSSVYDHSILIDSNVFMGFLGTSLPKGNVKYINNTFTSAEMHDNSTYYQYLFEGRLINCDIDIQHPPYSTCRAIINMDKNSQNNIIKINGSNRCQLYGAYNSTLVLNTVFSDNPIDNFDVVNCHILQMAQFSMCFYGATQEKTVVYRFKDSTLENVSSFLFRNNASHNAQKKIDTHIIFEDCVVEVSKIEAGCIMDLYIDLFNEEQNIKVTLKNSKFINKTQSKVNLFRFKQQYAERIHISIENCEFENITNNANDLYCS